jgi:ribosomal protein S18 acetylase RimI-like enzyme
MIRRATIADIANIYSLGSSRFNQEERSYGWTYERISSLILESHSYILERDGCVLGFCLASSDCVYADGCHIEWTAVTNEVNGFGARLFLHVLHKLKNTYAKDIFVDVQPSNHNVLNMLKRYGFQRYAIVGPFEILSLTREHARSEKAEKIAARCID